MKNYFNKFDKSNPTISKLNLFTKYYRNFIYKQIIKHGNFNEKKTILDYGCGNGYLKKINIKKKNISTIINYDIVKSLSEIEDPFKVDFDTIIFCQSLYLLTPEEIHKLLLKLKKKNNQLEILVVISYQSFFNKLISFLFFENQNYVGTKTNFNSELKTILKTCLILKTKNFIFSRLFVMKFKN